MCSRVWSLLSCLSGIVLQMYLHVVSITFISIEVIQKWLKIKQVYYKSLLLCLVFQNKRRGGVAMLFTKTMQYYAKKEEKV